MSCLSDTFCLAGSIFDLLYAGAAIVDFAGHVCFGDRWEALAPEVVARAEAIEGLISDFFARPLGGCQRYASLETIHG